MSALGAHGIRNAAPRIAQTDSGQARRRALEHAKHIELRGVPRTAMPADIRRAVIRANLQGVADVAIDYSHFVPTGRALLTLTRPEFLRDNLRALQKVTIAGVPISADAQLPPEEIPGRMRGSKGRDQALQRGLVTGNGPHGGIVNGEKNVVIWGFPGRADTDTVEAVTRDFQLSRSKGGRPSITKLLLPNGTFSMFSRFIVTLESVSEAHRLVRQFHQTPYEPHINGSRYLLRARIVY